MENSNLLVLFKRYWVFGRGVLVVDDDFVLVDFLVWCLVGCDFGGKIGILVFVFVELGWNVVLEFVLVWLGKLDWG